MEIRGEETTVTLIDGAIAATEEDCATEYDDYIISTRVVKDLDEAYQKMVNPDTEDVEESTSDTATEEN